jgi:uncharacterized membrane protein SpoIIM required for sporulation
MGEYLTRGFLSTLIVAFIFLVGFLFVSANRSYQFYLSAPPEVANQTLQQLQQERQTLTAYSIFLNNLLVSIPLVMPALGLIPFLIVWYNTGHIIGLLSLAYGVPPSTYILNLTVLGFPEICAYTLLTAENIYVTFAALTKGATRRITHHSWKSLIIYLALLVFAAIMEASMVG